ncbi:MAG: PEGA domain-containing protein [Myxococcales bacterium]|nr:PEGA domain-containing protein [Myxococcales bacterium]
MRGSILVALGTWLVLAGMAAGSAAQEPPARLLIVGPESRFLEPAQLERMAEDLRALVQRYPGLRRVEPAQPIEQLRKKARCLGSQPECLARLGKLAGAERVLHCEVQKLPGKYLVDVSLIETLRGNTLSQSRGRSEPSAEALQAALLKGWVEVLGPLPVRQIKVYANVTGADVFLDGQKLGQTPLILTRDPGPGAHRLEIAAAGYEPFSQEISAQESGDIHVEAVLRTRAPEADPALAAAPVAGRKISSGKDEDDGSAPPTPTSPPKPRASRPGWLRLADETPPDVAASSRTSETGAGPAKGPGPAREAPPSEEPKAFYRTWWFWTAIGLVVSGAAAGLVVGLAGEGGSGIPDGKGRLVLSF